MKTPLIAAATLLAAALNVPAQNENKSPELEILDRFVGTWDIDLGVKPAGAEEIKLKAVSHRTWSTRGTFIHFDDPGQPGEPEFQMLLTYDPEAKNYPGVLMSGPTRMEITGTWDEKTTTMSFESTSPDGTKMSSTHRFVGKDRAEAAGVFKNLEGDVVMEISWDQTKRSDKPLGKAPSVDELIANYHEAIGGLAANKKLTTRRSEGTLAFVGAPEAFKMTVIQKAPDLIYSKVVIPEFGEAFEGHDGKVAWKSNAAEGTVEFEGEELAQKLRDFQFYKYLDLKSDYKTLEPKGRQTENAKTYDALAATRKDGAVETFYFDAKTHLLGIVKRTDITLAMSDYKKVDGVTVAHTATVSIPDGTTVLTVKFGSVKHGVKVDETLFARPKE